MYLENTSDEKVASKYNTVQSVSVLIVYVARTDFIFVPLLSKFYKNNYSWIIVYYSNIYQLLLLIWKKNENTISIFYKNVEINNNGIVKICTVEIPVLHILNCISFPEVNGFEQYLSS